MIILASYSLQRPFTKSNSLGQALLGGNTRIPQTQLEDRGKIRTQGHLRKVAAHIGARRKESLLLFLRALLSPPFSPANHLPQQSFKFPGTVTNPSSVRYYRSSLRY